MSTEILSGAVREAGAAGGKLRISGAGQWMRAGRPTADAKPLPVRDNSGIVNYVPDDLTITVRAGTTLAEIDDVTHGRNQWLPLDPPGSAGGTIGATMATGSSGPLSHGFGLARDFILGIEFVTGKGEVVRSGGRVVKNVAGFDLMRLVCGSWGTLGVITELTLRLYARPKTARTFALAISAGATGVEKLTESLRSAPLAAHAMEMVSAGLAARIGLPEAEAILIRLAGNEALIDAQVRAIRRLGAVNEASGDVWEELRKADSGSSISFRMSGLPTEINAIWNAGRTALANGLGGWMHSTFSRGIVRIAASERNPAAALATLQSLAAGCRTVFEVLPKNLWPELSPSVVSSRLARDVKRTFDPFDVFNPGILG